MGEWIFKSDLSKEEIESRIITDSDYYDAFLGFFQDKENGPRRVQLLDDENYQELFEEWNNSDDIPWLGLILGYLLYYADIDFIDGITNIDKAGLWWAEERKPVMGLSHKEVIFKRNDAKL